MEQDPFIRLLVVLARLVVLFLALTFSRRFRAKQRVRRDLLRPSDRVVPAERHSQVHDRGTRSCEPRPPRRRPMPLRPGSGNLNRFR